MAESTRPRARHGDAPRWVLWHVLATFVGITAAVLLYGLVATLAGWDDAPGPGPVVSVAVVVILLSLFRQAQTRSPLIHVDRTYYRLALVFIALYGGMGTWRVGLVLGVLLLLHSVATRGNVRDSGERHPVTKDAPL